jgi:hypothetical protein
MNNFYVYLYIDPRNNIPRYVGKGSNGRIHDKHSRNQRVKDWIKRLESLGLEPIKKKYREHLDEQAAFQLEEKLITCIGRTKSNDDSEWGLYNNTDGGEGTSGYKWTEEQRQNPESIANNKLAAQKMVQDPEWRKNQKLATRHKGPHRGKKFKRTFFRGANNKWHTQITVNGKSKHLGYFNTEIEAAIAYNDGVDKYWGGEGYHNIIPENLT